ncbi:hypothetical protein [Actinoplanes subtropicus]|uniref:hypothetical protein n=1 Tax=Actinoplanes subtropicus TaxID=543632 RepID=UPI0004C455AF|nr:hypothetical protein [Actinoplanes subtropicus]
MTEQVLFLDPEPHSYRSRKIVIRPARRHAVVVLDRDDYVDAHGEENAAWPPEFHDAVDKLRMVFIDRLSLDGDSASFVWGGDRWITLYVPYPYVDDVVEVLRAVELDADLSGLEAMVGRLALPLDEWLAPGERLLRRGADFDARPTTFLRFLRHAARRQGLRLNGRATAAGVWVRPQLSPAERLSRAAFPEEYRDRPDRWTDAPQDERPWRPFDERIRDQDGGRAAVPVAFRNVAARPLSDCPCGFQNAFGEFGVGRHEQQHQLWSIGLRLPKNISWGRGNVAVVTTQSSVAWRRLAAKVAMAPKRENRYDFTSWEAGNRPEPSSTNRRAYLLRSVEYVIGYLVAADLDRHQRWNLDPDTPYTGDDTGTRPSIDLIWVAAIHRARGLGNALVHALAEDFGCPATDVSWSTPVSESGQRLARSLSPQGIWVH